jgi:DNA-binding transcriptional MerR regulator
MESFSGPQAARVAGVTYRQLDYWARTGLIAPSIQEAHGSGTQRHYSFGDLVRLRAVAQLIAAGIDLRKVRRAVEVLRQQSEDLGSLTVVSDGTTIYACRSPDEVVDLLRQGQGVFALALGPVLEQVRGSLLALRAGEAPGLGAGAVGEAGV